MVSKNTVDEVVRIMHVFANENNIPECRMLDLMLKIHEVKGNKSFHDSISGIIERMKIPIKVDKILDKKSENLKPTEEEKTLFKTNPIEAIKIYKNRTGTGLKESLEALKYA